MGIRLAVMRKTKKKKKKWTWGKGWVGEEVCVRPRWWSDGTRPEKRKKTEKKKRRWEGVEGSAVGWWGWVRD